MWATVHPLHPTLIRAHIFTLKYAQNVSVSKINLTQFRLLSRVYSNSNNGFARVTIYLVLFARQEMSEEVRRLPITIYQYNICQL